MLKIDFHLKKTDFLLVNRLCRLFGDPVVSFPASESAKHFLQTKYPSAGQSLNIPLFMIWKYVTDINKCCIHILVSWRINPSSFGSSCVFKNVKFAEMTPCKPTGSLPWNLQSTLCTVYWLTQLGFLFPEFLSPMFWSQVGYLKNDAWNHHFECWCYFPIIN